MTIKHPHPAVGKLVPTENARRHWKIPVAPAFRLP
jgi:hypothetical protein